MGYDVYDVTDADFQEKVIEKSKKIPVVIDFWAEWCHPCKVLKPVLEKLSEEYNGKFVLAKANVEYAQDASSKFGVSSIPAVKMMKDGIVVAEFTGSLPESRVKEWLDKNL
ncbi:MAG: thioredoxin [Candidatus Woesearchaeota archaeon]